MPTPRPPEFRSVKQLFRRLTSSDSTELVSVANDEVPTWQRESVWNDDDQGLLALSILEQYPIGLMVLWRKPNGVRVPVDGRQRLTAIKRFIAGEIAIPQNLYTVPPEYRGKKYVVHDDEADPSVSELSSSEKDRFDDYELTIVEYGTDASVEFVMDVFVRLQSGKSLTKTEIRAALGGRVCDFVTELTTDVSFASEDEGDESVPLSRHAFFLSLTPHLPNRRKAHRNVADVLLAEYFKSGSDKHWTSLEALYREKAETLTDREKSSFSDLLSRFNRDVSQSVNGQTSMIPQMRSTFFILSVFRAWRELSEKYAVPSDFDFAQAIQAFEKERADKKDEVPWVNFTSALSNAGYAINRSDARHEILMAYLLQSAPEATRLDAQRSFSTEQRHAIFYRADGQCEWKDDDGVRCHERFAQVGEADADHVVRWSEGGPTTVSNGRLLCPAHNRGRGAALGTG